MRDHDWSWRGSWGRGREPEVLGEEAAVGAGLEWDSAHGADRVLDRRPSGTRVCAHRYSGSPRPRRWPRETSGRARAAKPGAMSMEDPFFVVKG